MFSPFIEASGMYTTWLDPVGIIGGLTAAKAIVTVAGALVAIPSLTVKVKTRSRPRLRSAYR